MNILGKIVYVCNPKILMVCRVFTLIIIRSKVGCLLGLGTNFLLQVDDFGTKHLFAVFSMRVLWEP